MKNYSTEIKTGLIVIFAIALFIWGYNFLKGTNILSNQRDFYALYEKVEGLNQSNPVLINGVKVGIVQEIYFHPDQSGKVVIHMLLDDTEFNIPRNTVAMIISSDLLGSKAVQFVLGDEMEYAMPGDTLKSGIKASLTDEVNKTVEPIKMKALALFNQIDSLMASINDVFSKETRDNLTDGIASIKSTIQNLESTSAGIDTFINEETGRLKQIFANIQSISKNIKDNNEEIDHIIGNISSLTDTLVQTEIKNTIFQANRAIEETANIMEKINKGEGSMGMLINNDSLYKNLDQAALDLDELFKDMKKNPNRYVHFSVFGKKNKPVEEEKK